MWCFFPKKKYLPALRSRRGPVWRREPVWKWKVINIWNCCITHFHLTGNFSGLFWGPLSSPPSKETITLGGGGVGCLWQYVVASSKLCGEREGGGERAHQPHMGTAWVKGGGAIFLFAKKVYCEFFWRLFFFNFHQFYFFQYRIERRKICTVKMVQLLWPKKGYTIEKTMVFLWWVPIFEWQWRRLVFDPQGGASPLSPPPSLPMCAPNPFHFSAGPSASGDLI